MVSTAVYPEQPLAAVVVAKDSVISAESRSLRFRARLPGNTGIPPNAAVNVLVPIGVPQRLSHAPVTAVRRDGLGDYVFVLEHEPADGSTGKSYRARRQSVTLGLEKDQMVAIVAGLQDGDLIAANGAFKLRNGLLVYVKPRRLIGKSNQDSGKNSVLATEHKQ
jgi:membrane fusion protein (multidrug efflux system)